MVVGLEGARSFFRQKGLLAGFVIVVNTYSWNFPLYILFESQVSHLVTKRLLDYSSFTYIIAAYYLAAVVSAFAGVFLVNKYQIRDKILVSWMLSGVLSSVLLVFLPTADYSSLIFALLLLGFSLGFGFPSSLAYFSDYNVENKGTGAGIAFLASGFGILIVGSLTTALLSFKISVLILPIIFILWRGIGCILFLLFKPKREEKTEHTYLNVTYRYVLGERKFVLYFLPWIIYTVINYLGVALLRDFFANDLGNQFIESMLIAEFAIGGIVALIAGYISDRIGRKLVVACGFVVLGVGYALLGLFSTSVNPVVRANAAYVYVLVDGISVGIFTMAFFLLLWGELAIDKPKEKYYLLGELPFLIFSYLGILVKPYLNLMFPEPSSAFSLAAFFLFLAILPLMYATETLPQKKIRDREFKSYIEKAKKTKEKHT